MKRAFLSLIAIVLTVTSAAFFMPQDADALAGRASFKCKPHFTGGYYGNRCPPRKMHPEQDKYPGHSYHTIRVRLTIDDPSNVDDDTFSDTFYCDCGRGTIKCTITADYDPPTGRTGRWIVGPTDASAGGGNDSSSTVNFRYQLDALDPYDLDAGITKDRDTVMPGGTITWTHSATLTSQGEPIENVRAESGTQRKGPMVSDNAIDDTKTRLHAGQNNVQNSGLPEQVLLEGGIRERVCLFGSVGCTDRVKNPWSYRDIAGNVFLTSSTRKTQSFTSTLTVGKDTPEGTELCRQTVIDKARYNGKTSYSSDASGFACVRVTSDATTRYSLTPRVTVDGGPIGDPGSSVSITPTVTNSGPSQSRPTEWEVTRMLLPPGINLGVKENGGDSPDAACGNYFRPAPASGGSCSVISRGADRVFSRINAAEALQVVASQLDDEPIGTRFCFALSIKPPTHESSADNTWRHSKIECVKVGKRPKVQIHGGDLMVGRTFAGATAIPSLASIVSTSNTQRDGKQFGSWIEYAIAAPGAVRNTGSAAGLADGNSGVNQSNWSRLTFANSSEFGKFGTPKSTIPDVVSAVKSKYNVSRAPQVSGNLQITPTMKDVRTATGDVTLAGYTFDTPGQTLVIYAPNRTVTVAGNIAYGSMRLTSGKDIPQLIIIANDIRINAGVERIDAWLVAQGVSGQINTCADVNNLSASVCEKPLVVNGPVAAKQLNLRRTAGSSGTDDGGRSAPAEVFNLRADAYLWAYSIDSDQRRALTTYTSELPPRF